MVALLFVPLQSMVLEHGEKEETMELSFEYLLNKDSLQWITIASDEVSCIGKVATIQLKNLYKLLH